MKARDFYFCLIAILLHDGNTGQVNRGIPAYRHMEGENIRVECTFSYSGTKKFFCKGKCEKQNILIGTTENTANNSRYSIQYIKKGPLSSDIMYVIIAQLKKSDTGRYMCLSETWRGELSHEFYIHVTEASTAITESSSEASKRPEISPASSGWSLHLGIRVAVVVLVLLLPVVVFLICKKKDFSSRRNSDRQGTARADRQSLAELQNKYYENSPAVSTE